MEYTSQNNLNYYEFMLEYNKIIVNLPTFFLPVCQQYDLFKRTESHWPIGQFTVVFACKNLKCTEKVQTNF